MKIFDSNEVTPRQMILVAIMVVSFIFLMFLISTGEKIVKETPKSWNIDERYE